MLKNKKRGTGLIYNTRVFLEQELKLLILFSVLVLTVYVLFSSGGFLTSYAVKGNEPIEPLVVAAVEPEIEQELSTDQEVEVIVELKETSVPKITAEVTLDVLEEKSKITKAKEKKVLEKLSTQEFKKENSFKTFSGFSGTVTKEGLEKLKRDPNVKKIYLDDQFDVFLSDSIAVINADDVHNLGYSGSGQTVCILDTGTDYNHADLSGNYLGGYDYANNDNDPIDDHGHGTHVTGIVAANGNTIGIAKDAKFVSLKVCSAAGSCSSSDVTSAIEWCTFNQTAFGISVITMSLGGGLYTSNCDAAFPSIKTAVDTAISQNITVLVATGNSGSTTGIAAPACLSNVIAVGGTDKSDNMYSGGNRNSITDILGPGVAIVSTANTGGTTTLSGTSMSTPHVSATAALLQQYNLDLGNTVLTYQQVKDKLINNAVSISDSGSGLTFPRVDALLAISSFDETKPVINFTGLTPADNITINQQFAFINLTSNEDLASALLQWNDNNESMNGSNTNFYLNKTNLTGTYNYKAFGTDFNDNIGTTELRQLSINNSAPEITIIAPLNNQTFSTKQINFEFNVTDDLDSSFSCDIIVNGDSNLVTANKDELTTLAKTLQDNSYDSNIVCNDTSKTTTSSNVTFTVSAPAIISGEKPNNTDVITDTNVVLHFLTDEAASCNGDLTGNNTFSQMNFSFSGTINHTYTTNLSVGSQNVYSACNDSSDQLSYDDWSFTISGETTTTTSTTTTVSNTTTTTAESSGRGGGSGSIEAELEPALLPIVSETPTEIPEPKTTDAATVEEITTVEETTTTIEGTGFVGGFVNVAGNVVNAVKEKPAVYSSIIAVIGVLIFVLKLFIGRGIGGMNLKSFFRKKKVAKMPEERRSRIIDIPKI